MIYRLTRLPELWARFAGQPKRCSIYFSQNTSFVELQELLNSSANGLSRDFSNECRPELPALKAS